MRIPIRLRLQSRLRKRARFLLAKGLLGTQPIQVLGHGAFSSTFAIGNKRVLKITDSSDLSATWFSRYIERNSNIHWPRIYRQIRKSRFVVFYLERLFPLNNVGYAEIAGADDLLINIKYNSLASLIQYVELTGEDMEFLRCPQRLRLPLIDCHREASAAGLIPDNKRSAYMRRVGGTLVLADPFLVKHKFF